MYLNERIKKTFFFVIMMKSRQTKRCMRIFNRRRKSATLHAHSHAHAKKLAFAARVEKSVNCVGNFSILQQGKIHLILELFRSNLFWLNAYTHTHTQCASVLYAFACKRNQYLHIQCDRLRKKNLVISGTNGDRLHIFKVRFSLSFFFARAT